MLKQQIEQQMKEALKTGNASLLSTLRFLMASIKNLEIEKRAEASDEDVISVVQKQIKQHRESIEAFQKAGRKDLEDKEKFELEVLLKYLPAQMSEEELRVVVKEAIDQLPEAERNNFGKVMGAVMGRVKGKADGNIVGKVVKESIK